jgi:hypothetical protein
MSRIALLGPLNTPDWFDFAPMPSDEWEKYRRNALRYLRASGAPLETVTTLSELPFVCDHIVVPLQTGGVGLHTEHQLKLSVPVEVFVEIERQTGSWANRIAEQIPQIANSVGRGGCPVWRVIAEIELDADNDSLELIQADDLQITSATVEHALNQARTLIVSHGAPAALDRVHTVFHAYLKAVCERAQIPMPSQTPGIITLLGLLRQHGVVSFEPELEDLVKKTFRGVQKAVDALEDFRNKHSLAHPQQMLPEPEALLVINVTQAMLRYIDARLT